MPRITVSSPQKPLQVAQQFARAEHGDPRAPQLVHHRGVFYHWCGTCWKEVDVRSIRADLYQWLGNAVYEDFVPFDPTKAKVANVLEALEAVVHLDGRLEPPCWQGEPASPAEETVALENGLLHLPTKQLHPHTPAFFNLHALSFPFDPDAPQPERWLRFLHQLWEDDDESIGTLAEVMGYTLAGGTAQQKILLFVGPKRAGKGTILRVQTALLGRENVAAPTLSSLGTQFGLQSLIGKPLATITDARLGSRADGSAAVERLLSISGEDVVTVDRKYRDPWTGRLPTRFVIVTNELPRLIDASGAIASRFVILTFPNSFFGRENPNLTDELLAEAPAIFNWALAGLDRLRDRGHFKQPAAGESAVRHLADLSSPVSAFVRDRCLIEPTTHVDKDLLWKAYRDWCEEEGARPGTRAVFLRDLRAAVPGAVPARPGPRGDRRRVIRGVALIDTTMPSTLDTSDTVGSVSGVSRVTHTVQPSHTGNGGLLPEHEQAVIDALGDMLHARERENE
jgi:putative DNA primase/helicase